MNMSIQCINHKDVILKYLSLCSCLLYFGGYVIIVRIYSLPLSTRANLLSRLKCTSVLGVDVSCRIWV